MQNYSKGIQQFTLKAEFEWIPEQDIFSRRKSSKFVNHYAHFPHWKTRTRNDAIKLLPIWSLRDSNAVHKYIPTLNSNAILVYLRKSKIGRCQHKNHLKRNILNEMMTRNSFLKRHRVAHAVMSAAHTRINPSTAFNRLISRCWRVNSCLANDAINIWYSRITAAGEWEDDEEMIYSFAQ